MVCVSVTNGGRIMKKTLLCIFLSTLLILGVFQFPIRGTITDTTLNTHEEQRNQYNGFLDVTFTAGKYTITSLPNGRSELSMAGYGNLLTPGHPMLPTKTFFVGLPPGCTLDTIELLEEKTTQVPGRYTLQNAPKVWSDYRRTIEKNQDEHLSLTTEIYPADLYEYLGPSHLRKYSLARIRFSPMTYYPESQTLLLHDHITLRLHYKPTDTVSDVLLSDTAMDDVAADLIYNYATISRLLSSTRTKTTDL
jgi:hypothetical protein